MATYKADALADAQMMISYNFTNTELCWEALQAKAAGGYAEGNKRLALVGDAVLRLLIIKSWYTTGDRTGKQKQ
jgi:dsRNA-specific ribonuclease